MKQVKIKPNLSPNASSKKFREKIFHSQIDEEIENSLSDSERQSFVDIIKTQNIITQDPIEFDDLSEGSQHNQFQFKKDQAEDPRRVCLQLNHFIIIS